VKINPAIQKYGGFIDKYLDDGVMALFPDDSSNAVTCALEIQRCINEYNAERMVENLPLIRFSAGIHCDDLMIGTIGEGDRIESAVISDAVGVTSQLVRFADAQKFPIAVSYEIAMALGKEKSDKYVLVPHGKCKINAALPPVVVFEVKAR
jgi:class 3 adenylate cyclase